MFLVEQFDPEESTEDWQVHWFEFAKRIYPEDTPPRISVSDPESRQDVIDWIDRVVDEFTNYEHRKWDSFLKLIEEVAVK